VCMGGGGSSPPVSSACGYGVKRLVFYPSSCGFSKLSRVAVGTKQALVSQFRVQGCVTVNRPCPRILVEALWNSKQAMFLPLVNDSGFSLPTRLTSKFRVRVADQQAGHVSPFIKLFRVQPADTANMPYKF
jgi:hypothetical protein